MTTSLVRKIVRITLGLIAFCLFSITHAQSIFYHLLPGFIANYTWVGLGADSNWTTGQNWSNGSAPGVGQVAIFDDHCIAAACNAIINTSISIGGMDIKSNYSGTISQAAGQTITVGSSGWIQANGSFSGGDSNITLSGSTLTLSNSASFVSTTAQTFFNLTQGATTTLITAPAGTTLTFPNGSKQKFAVTSACGMPNYSISSPQKISFYDLEMSTSATGCGYAIWGNSTGTLEVRNNFTFLTNDSLNMVGSYEVYGNVTSAGNVYTYNNSADWYLLGNTSTTYTGAGGLGFVLVNKTGGATVTPSTAVETFKMLGLRVIAGTITLPQTLYFHWNYAAAKKYFQVDAGGAVVIPANSTVTISADQTCSPGTNRTIDTNSTINFENLTLQGIAGGCGSYTNLVLAAGTSVVVKKNLTLGNYVYNNFPITVEGNLVTSTQTLGSMAVSMTSGVAATSTINPAGFVSGTYTIAKTASTVTATGNISLNNIGQDLNVSSGIMDMAGFNLTVNDQITVANGAKLLCNGGSVTAAGWTINGEVSCGTTIGITWTGLAGDGLWSTAGNWTNNTIPGASDIAIFNSSCVGVACNAQIDSNLSVKGIILQSTYSGSLTQNATRTLTIGTAGFNQAGGAFAGADATITMNGPYSLSGGTFMATSGTWIQSANFTVSGAPTFVHNSGTLEINETMTLSANSIQVNNLTFNGAYKNKNLNSQTVIVMGQLLLSDASGALGSINSGTIEARGNVTSTVGGSGGTALIKINGTGAQTLTGTSGSFPSIEINKAAGTLTMVGNVQIYAANWTHTAGTVDAGTSTLTFIPWSGGSIQIIPGTMNYNNVTFAGPYQTRNLNSGTMVVLGTLTLSDSGGAVGAINSGTIEARGDVTSVQGGSGGSALIKINGTGAQALTGTSGSFPSIEINKAAGTLTMVGNIQIYAANWTHTAGTVDAGTSTLTFIPWSGGSIQIVPGTMSYNNVTFTGPYQSRNLNSGTMVVLGTLTLSDSGGAVGAINSGTIEARGDVTTTSGGGTGSVLIKISGTGAQTLTGTSGSIPSIEIDKPSGTLTMAGNIQLYSANWTHSAGTVNAGTSTLTFTSLAGSAIQIVPGTMNYNNVTFTGPYQSRNLNSGTMVVLGTLTLSDSGGAVGSINSGNIEARSHISISGAGASGSANLSATSAASANLTWSAGSLFSTQFIIAKTGGASLVAQANANLSSSVNQDLTIASGTFDLNTFDLTVPSTLTVSVGATLKCNGGEYTAGTTTNSGTVNCPGFATYDFNWTGAAANGLFSDATNWQGGVAPGPGDIVVFQDTYCGANCSATISSAANIRGVKLRSPYTGTLTQSAGQTLTIGPRGWTQAAGTFTGGNSAVTIGGLVSITAGTFTSTSGLLTMNGASWTKSGGVFNHNNGTFEYGVSAPTSSTFNPGTDDFYNLNLVTWAANYTIAGTVNVANTFQFGTASGSSTNMSGGTINAKGHVNVLDNGLGTNTDTTNIQINGTGNQTVTGGAGNSAWPTMTINKSSGTVTFAGTIRLHNTLNYLAGTVDPGTSTFIFYRLNGTKTDSPNGINLNNVTFLHQSSSAFENLNNQTLNVGGTLTFNHQSTGAQINSGTINASGNVVLAGSSGISGSMNLNLIGSNDTTITPNSTYAIPGATVTVNKSSGAKVTLAGNTFFNNAGQNLVISAGTLSMAGYNLNVGNNIVNSDTLKLGNNPTCGIVTLGGSFSGNPTICP